MKPASYVVVTPVRNEERYLPNTIRSTVSQTHLPLRWVLVNDGSTDRTGEIIHAAAQDYSWIRFVTRPDRGYRKAGGGVIDAFYTGYKLLDGLDWDYLVKLDGDLSFGINYFEECLRQFELDPKLGIGGGTICGENGEVESKDPRFHVRGATKIYRHECWQQIGGLLRAPGWDTLDEVKANMLDWATVTFAQVKATQHRPTGAAYGAWRDGTKGGTGHYISGYHPLFMLLKCVKRMTQRPYFLFGFALFVGFVRAYIKGIPRIDDPPLIRYFRQQQLNRLLGRKSLWSNGSESPFP